MLSRDSSIAQDIREMTKVVEDIKSVRNIAERNHKLEAKRNKIKSKVENTTCQLAPPTPCKHTPYKGKKPNALKWQRRVDIVQDPLEAVRLLVRRLGIVAVDEWNAIVGLVLTLSSSRLLNAHLVHFSKTRAWIFCVYYLFLSVLSRFKRRLVYFIFAHDGGVVHNRREQQSNKILALELIEAVSQF